MRPLSALFALAAFAPVALAQTPGPAGTFAVDGRMPNADLLNAQPYTGTATIARRGDRIYSIAWRTGSGDQPTTSEGVGLLDGDRFAVTWGHPACGIALFTRGPAGHMAGRWVMMNGTHAGSEIHTPDGPPSPLSSGGTAQLYRLQGTNPPPSGQSYSGMFASSRRGIGLVGLWRVGEARYSGPGMRSNQYDAFAYGGDACNVAVYTIEADGTLKGAWMTQQNQFVGFETLTRQ